MKRFAATSLTVLALWGSASNAASTRQPTSSGLVYGQASGVKLTLDYYAPTGSWPHPIAIIIHGGGWTAGSNTSESEAYCADFLAPAGYAVFSINYRLAPQYPYPAMLEDVERAVRFVRFHAVEWDADPDKIALVGGSAGGLLSNLAGLRQMPGNPGASDPVDRVSARVQAVVTLFAHSDLRDEKWGKCGPGLHALLDSYIQEKGKTVALTEASPITHVTQAAPPFLLIHGDKDAVIDFEQSVHLQTALRAAGDKCDLIRIPNGSHGSSGWPRVPDLPDWERQMTEWLNRTLNYHGQVGQGIKVRKPQHHPAK